MSAFDTLTGAFLEYQKWVGKKLTVQVRQSYAVTGKIVSATSKAFTLIETGGKKWRIPWSFYVSKGSKISTGAAKAPARTRTRSPKARKSEVAVKGKKGRIDLVKLRDEVARKYFGGEKLPISWFRQYVRGTRVNYIKFGYYRTHEKTIHINEILDHKEVPADFVRHVIFHEMCHHRTPIETDRRGRRIAHGTKFNSCERRSPHHRMHDLMAKKNFSLFAGILMKRL